MMSVCGSSAVCGRCADVHTASGDGRIIHDYACSYAIIVGKHHKALHIMFWDITQANTIPIKTTRALTKLT